MYKTCTFCGLTFKNTSARTDCPYCRSTYLLEATPMEILLQQRFDDEILDSFYPGLTETIHTDDEHSAA